MGSGDPQDRGDDPARGETLTYPGSVARVAPPTELARGSSVHRFVILDRIGEGGMGVVYAAYDPSLDRRVALKFLRLQGPDRDGTREKRLLREAQAMARLSHPNVAVVYEVGTFQEHLFVAMEFVDGVDLRSWLSGQSRPLSEVLELFRAAGRGLAAAHEAGIIHRDFKPENVLVDKVGRPRVTDFGLSRSQRLDETDQDPIPELEADPLFTPSHLSMPLTRTGGIVGTLWYMSPEQHRGVEADTATDQFAFCVALYEAVAGRRPFDGDSRAEIAEAIIARRIAPPATEMPRWLRAVVMRGLEPSPGDRWPNMEALLAALSRGRASRWRWLLAGAATAALATGAMALFALPQSEACPSARNKVASIWSAPVRDKVRAAFLATGRPHALSVFQRAEQTFGDRLSGWVGAHREACLATRIRGEQSEGLLDLRMQCLERARRQLEALPEVWQEDVNLSEAVRAALTVGEIEACSDTSSLAASVPPPHDPKRVRQLETLQRTLDRVAALQRAGQLEAGLSLAREATAGARKLGHAPVLAEALHRNAQLELDIGKYEVGFDLLDEAFRAANEAHDDVRAATVIRFLLYYGSSNSEQRAKADVLWKMAEAVLARLPDHDDLRADLLNTQAIVLFRQGKRPESIDYLRRAVALKEKLHGPLAYQVLASVNNLAAHLADSAATDEALAASQRALAILERTLGQEHPYFATALVNHTVVLLEAGNYDGAASAAERSLALRSKIFPPGHSSVASALNTLAMVRRMQDSDDEARSLLDRALRILDEAKALDDSLAVAVRQHLAELAIRRRDVGVARQLLENVIAGQAKASPGGASTPGTQNVLGSLLLLERDPVGARAAYEHSLALGRKRGEDPLEVAAAMTGLGEVALFERKADAAMEHFARAREVFESRPITRRHPMLVPAMTGQGRAHLIAGRTSQAIAVLEEADRLAEAHGSSTRVAGARARFALAQARWAAGERERAIELAGRSRDVLAGRPEASEIDSWLRQHATR
jgi:tetratricopeptide (TPR) repeat protein/predicted Ser/Thr protein kinase